MQTTEYEIKLRKRKWELENELDAAQQEQKAVTRRIHLATDALNEIEKSLNDTKIFLSIYVTEVIGLPDISRIICNYTEIMPKMEVLIIDYSALNRKTQEQLRMTNFENTNIYMSQQAFNGYSYEWGFSITFYGDRVWYPRYDYNLVVCLMSGDDSIILINRTENTHNQLRFQARIHAIQETFEFGEERSNPRTWLVPKILDFRLIVIKHFNCNITIHQ